MHGANAPLMRSLVAEQMEKERRVQAGELERETIKLEDAVPVSEITEEPTPASNSNKLDWLNDMKSKSKKKEENKTEEVSQENGKMEEDKVRNVYDSQDTRLLLATDSLVKDSGVVKKIMDELQLTGVDKDILYCELNNINHIVGYEISSYVPFATKKNVLAETDAASLAAVLNSDRPTAIVIEPLKEKTTGNDVGDKLDETFTEDFEKKLELKEDQHCFFPSSKLSSALVTSMKSLIVSLFKIENSEEAVQKFETMENVKIVSMKEMTLTQEMAKSLCVEEAENETLTKENHLFVLLLNEDENQVEKIPEEVLRKDGLELNVIGSIFHL